LLLSQFKVSKNPDWVERANPSRMYKQAFNSGNIIQNE